MPDIPDDAREALEKVSKKYIFRANDYYLSLIDWHDPEDPIRQLIIPREEELEDWGQLDASNEKAVTVARGVQHKYHDTVLMLCNDVCGAYCRYCFRKRLFMDDNEETTRDVGPGIEYIREHTEVTDVLLTGGDPLLMSTGKLQRILDQLNEIDHVRVVRIGTKMPAFNPWRVLDDQNLQALIRDNSTYKRPIYIMAHFDHPNELTDPAKQGIETLQHCNARVVNQCPLIKGVNDDVETLRDLFTTMTYLGAPQYYVFQGRPTAGNAPYELPLVRSFRLFDAARQGLSGLSRRVRFCMSHATGKIEMIGLDDERIYMRYHRALDPQNESRVIILKRDDEAFWLDQLEPASIG
ncbi:KamA family radical SAM protein [bacterium]|nr:KamA family radical SAM protein [bacterium]